MCNLKYLKFNKILDKEYDSIVNLKSFRKQKIIFLFNFKRLNYVKAYSFYLDCVAIIV